MQNEYDELLQDISTKLISTRNAIGMSQGKLYKLSGVSQSNICRIETATKNVTVSTLAILVDAMGKKLHIDIIPKVDSILYMDLILNSEFTFVHKSDWVIGFQHNGFEDIIKFDIESNASCCDLINSFNKLYFLKESFTFKYIRVVNDGISEEMFKEIIDTLYTYLYPEAVIIKLNINEPSLPEASPIHPYINAIIPAPPINIPIKTDNIIDNKEIIKPVKIKKSKVKNTILIDELNHIVILDDDLEITKLTEDIVLFRDLNNNTEIEMKLNNMRECGRFNKQLNIARVTKTEFVYKEIKFTIQHFTKNKYNILNAILASIIEMYFLNDFASL